MMYRRFLGALLTAAVVFGALSAGQTHADGPRRAAIVPYGYADPFGAPYLAPAYGYYYNPYSYNPYGAPFEAFGYYYNPYVAPFPAYGILPPPFATLRMAYGAIERERTEVRRARPPERSAEDLIADVTRFRFEITVPTADAIVLVGGAKTTQTGLQRVYLTPPLVVDRYYTYTVEVQWTEGGVAKTEKASFDFLLGEPTKKLQFPLKMMK
jgi:uncharacterized protein (TIGR03000 family)